MKLSHAILCAALGGIAATAHADFGYSATISSTSSNSGQSVVNYSPINHDSYSAEATPGTGTTIFLGRSSAYSGASHDVFSSVPPYTISLTIDDYDLGTGTLTFAGTISGYMDFKQSALVNTYADPYVKALTVQTNGVSKTYTVTLLPWSPPGSGIDVEGGAIQAFVTAAPTATGVASVNIPSGVKAGHGVQGTVTLNGPAPYGGALVTFTSGTPGALAVSPSVFIPAGTSAGLFLVSAVSANAGVSVQAKWNGSTASQSVPITGAICWDVDGSGAVNIADAVKLLRGVAGLDTLPSC